MLIGVCVEYKESKSGKAVRLLQGRKNMSVTIIVKYVNLTAAAKKLRTMKNNLNSRELSINIKTCEGQVANELQNIVSELNQIGSCISVLAGNTEKVVNNAIVEFKKSDELAAQLIRKIK